MEFIRLSAADAPFTEDGLLVMNVGDDEWIAATLVDTERERTKRVVRDFDIEGAILFLFCVYDIFVRSMCIVLFFDLSVVVRLMFFEVQC